MSGRAGRAPRRGAWAALRRAALGLTLAGCVGGRDPSDAPVDSDLVDSGPSAAVPYPLAHTCIEYAAIAATLVPWDTLRNPLVDLPGVSLSDVSVRFTVGRWHLFASRRTAATGRRDVLHLESPDTVHWEEAGAFDLPSAGGLVTPDLTRDDDGRFLLTTTTWAEGDVRPETLAWGSDELVSWDGPVVFDPGSGTGLEPQVTEVTLGHAAVGLVSMSTWASQTHVAVSRERGLEGGWAPQPAELRMKFPRLLQIDEVWHALGSTRSDGAPTLARLTGDPGKARGWSSWGAPRTLAVPAETWNAGVTATGASLCDARGIDGFAYLFFAGSDGWDFTSGHGAIGIARSRDLITWELPGAAPVSRRSSP